MIGAKSFGMVRDLFRAMAREVVGQVTRIKGTSNAGRRRGRTPTQRFERRKRARTVALARARMRRRRRNAIAKASRRAGRGRGTRRQG